jgi:hypothetical protein
VEHSGPPPPILQIESVWTTHTYTAFAGACRYNLCGLNTNSTSMATDRDVADLYQRRLPRHPTNTFLRTILYMSSRLSYLPEQRLQHTFRPHPMAAVQSYLSCSKYPRLHVAHGEVIKSLANPLQVTALNPTHGEIILILPSGFRGSFTRHASQHYGLITEKIYRWAEHHGTRWIEYV